MNLLFAEYAKPEDAPVLGKIMAVSLRSAFAGFLSQQTLDRCSVPENCAGLFRELLKDAQMKILIGGMDEEPMGLLVWADTPDNAVEIMAVYSLPESWGSGLGACMLDFALEEIGGRNVFLWAFEENARARRFYEKHGFQWNGDRRVSEFDGAVEVCYRLNRE